VPRAQSPRVTAQSDISPPASLGFTARYRGRIDSASGLVLKGVLGIGIITIHRRGLSA